MNIALRLFDLLIFLISMCRNSEFDNEKNGCYTRINFNNSVANSMQNYLRNSGTIFHS